MLNLFIADLHLDTNNPQGIDTFIEFLKIKATKADKLYILGDLFEAWIGDEDLNQNYKIIAEALSDLRKKNTLCYFMHGNRDFLVGQNFSEITGCHILPEEEIIYINEKKVLLTHGDLLCTDDIEYLKFRSEVRNKKWKENFLNKTLKERNIIANKLRESSKDAMQSKSEKIMDVNENTVKEYMMKHSVSIIVHVHTHRPNIHKYLINNQECSRVVLGAWHDDPKYLQWDNSGYKLVSL